MKEYTVYFVFSNGVMEKYPDVYKTVEEAKNEIESFADFYDEGDLVGAMIKETTEENTFYLLDNGKLKRGFQ